jgi:hypothetical protein
MHRLDQLTVQRLLCWEVLRRSSWPGKGLLRLASPAAETPGGGGARRGAKAVGPRQLSPVRRDALGVSRLKLNNELQQTSTDGRQSNWEPDLAAAAMMSITLDRSAGPGKEGRQDLDCLL